jgi:superfamily II DNA helicase RecQ
LPILNEAVVTLRAVTSRVRRVTDRAFLDRMVGHMAGHVMQRAAAALSRFRPSFFPATDGRLELTPSEWRSILYQLRRAHLIETDPNDAECWAFTEEGLAILAAAEGEIDVAAMTLSSGRSVAIRDALAEISAAQEKPPPPPRRETELQPIRSEARPVLSVTELRRLAALKTARLEFAKARKVAACEIVHDKVLVEIARMRPRTKEDLTRLQDMDEATLERLGTKILAVLDRHDATD